VKNRIRATLVRTVLWNCYFWQEYERYEQNRKKLVRTVPSRRFDINDPSLNCKEIFRLYAEDIQMVTYWLDIPAVIITKNRHRVEGYEADIVLVGTSQL
jgi:hypothetical protein